MNLAAEATQLTKQDPAVATLAYLYSAATPRFYGVLWLSIALPFSDMG
jgi:hypothetical protein